MRWHSSRSFPCPRHSTGVRSASPALISNEMALPESFAIRSSAPQAKTSCRKVNQTQSYAVAKHAPARSADATIRLGRRTTFHNFEHDFSRSGFILWQNKSLADTVVTLQSTVTEIFL
jgi:hypothetical protein